MTYPFGLPPVRVRGATVWCVAAVSSIYLGCAAFEVRQDAATARQALARRRYGYGPPEVMLKDIEGVRAMIAAASGRNPIRLPATFPPAPSPPPPQTPSSILGDAWSDLPEAGKLMTGIVSVNVGVFALERLLPSTAAYFSHLPVSGANFTMLSSAFGHVGITHLALNMYGVVQFLPPVAYSPTFTGSGSHLAAFYLSSGVLSSYAFHLASVWPRPMDRLIGARGASGAVMAVVGVFGMSFPEQHLGIILVPGSLPVSQFLTGLALFEAYGLFVGFKRLRLAHAAHLAGLGLGSAYVYFDGRRNVWIPLRRWTFKQMRRLDLV